MNSICMTMAASAAMLGLLSNAAIASDPWPGYTLISPMGSTTTSLIDNNGDTYHSWNTGYRPALSAYLLEDGSLMRTAQLTGPGQSFNGTGGAGGRVERYDWDGNLTWEYEYSGSGYRLHHDIEVLPSGNVLMIAWEQVSRAEAIAAGRDPNQLSDGELWPDHIIEVQPTGSSGGNIVWEWSAWDHLVQDYDVAQDNYGVVADSPQRIDVNYVSGRETADWNHTNSIDYNAELDQILVSARSFNEIWIIDHDTTTAEAAGSAGDLLYRWGNPEAYDKGTSIDRVFYGQHDAEWIEDGLPGEGNILVFNNGSTPASRAYSSVDELAPPLETDGSYTLTDGEFGPNSLEWTYLADPTTDFFADHISGSQRLANGNTLITDGTGGRLFEVTSSGEVVWEYDVGSEIFRADRYDLDYVPQLIGDFDIDGDVDGADFLMWQRGKSPDPLSTTDLANWQTYYGAASNYPVNLAVVPEPSTFVLLALGPASLIMLGCHRLRRAEQIEEKGKNDENSMQHTDDHSGRTRPVQTHLRGG